MITFHCSCGKQYQLPDRHAGREVRCNQCGNPLIVPATSTAAPPPTPQPATTMDADHVPQSHTLQSHTVQQEKEAAQWGNVPVPNGEKNDLSPIVSGWTTGPYQKSSSCILTIVLVLLGAGIAFFGGFIFGGLLHQAGTREHHHTDDSEVTMESESEQKQDFVTEIKEYSLADWMIDGKEPVSFIVKTIDGKEIQLTADGDPTVGEKKNALDNIADALESNKESKETPSHNQTLRIDSKSSNIFRFIWPSSPGTANLDAGKFKSIYFSFYIPDKINAAFKPGKPEGADKVLVLSELGLRLVTECGYIEFLPESREKFAAICERAKSGFVSVQIPISGDETWKRTDQGTFGSQTVQRIELYAKPTGNGATLWIDHIGIEE